MSISSVGWANKGGTSKRSCNCSSWKQHWLNDSSQQWPNECFVRDCSSKPILGAHIYNPDVSGEYIAPFCDSCNKRSDKFDLKGRVTIVSANKQKTCQV